MNAFLNSIVSISSPQLIATATGLGVFFLIIFLAVIKDELRYKYERQAKDVSNEWLFSHWDTKLYDAITQKKPEEVLKKLGVNTEQYLKDCSITKRYFPNLKKLAADKLIGTIIILIAFVLILFSRTNGLVLNLVIFLAGVVIYQGDIGKVKKEAANRRRQIEIELPRFLDLLQTALYINMPIDEAIVVTSRNMKGTMIADELLATMAEAQIGVLSWQEALGDIAQKYEVDTLSDFVQYLIIGYEKGLSIYDIVSRQAREVREYERASAREQANKVNTSIIMPIALFKLFPLIALIAYPLLVQFLGGGVF